ncbi:MAG: hypothetical protein V7784_06640 [Oceanospirillaceae bacterium]
MNIVVDFFSKYWFLFIRFFIYGFTFFSICIWFTRDWSDYEEHVELGTLLLRVGAMASKGGLMTCIACMSAIILFNYYRKVLATKNDYYH